MFKIHSQEVQFGDKKIVLETGKIARQATGSVTVRMGKSVVLCTAVASKKAKEDIDFFPLTVHYQDKFYAAGKFPGGFNKRESRPTEREVLTSRLIDRPIRPLFPDNFRNEVQVICTTVSYDPETNPDILGIIGASAALAISGIPFEKPIAGIRVGYKDGEYTINPSIEEIADGSELDLIIAGTEDAVLMVESTAKELSEETMLGAVNFGHKAFQPVIKAIKKLAKDVGNTPWELPQEDNSDIEKAVKTIAEKKIAKAYAIIDKGERRNMLDEIKDEVNTALVEEKELNSTKVAACFKKLEKNIVRSQLIKSKKRIDGRKEDEVRQIECETDLLPSVHGSALFTRGETQALVITTLGTGENEQLVDDIEGDRKDTFMLHYNFPPYSVGEAGRIGPPGRREIGHGKLAFRAINPLLPSKEDFPYTIRVVSEITESNGSSSMATVCGASMSLMASGVPLPAPVAGIAMGLVLEGSKYSILSDIMGDEDHLGDMDFKVAGTNSGITALQMDIKISGITSEIMEKALEQAKGGRLHILDEMSKAISKSNTDISNNAPQIKSFQVPKEKIGGIIGPGGKMIKEIIEKTGVKIDISDDGTVNVASVCADGMKEALDIINDITAEPEVGKIYNGKVTKITDFGAFVAYMKNSEGLLHISEMSAERVNHPSDVLKEGDEVEVKLLSVEANGKVRLTLKFGENFDNKKSEDSSSNENGDGEKPSEPREKKERPRRSGPRKSGSNDRRNNKRDSRSGGDRDKNTRSDSQPPAKKKLRFF